MKTVLRTALSLVVCASLLLNGGCTEDKIVTVLRDGINTFAPSQWENSINGILTKLDAIGGDLAHKVADEIRSLMNDASLQLRQLAGFVENQAFCTYDFVGTRVELRLKRIAYDFYPSKFPKPSYLPAICNVVPDKISAKSTDVVRFYGFDFLRFSGTYLVTIQEDKENGKVVKSGFATFAPPSDYQGSIHFEPDDMSDLDPTKKYKVVLRWNNLPLEKNVDTKSQRSEVVILWPTPTTIPPTPVPTLPATYTTPRFSEEDPEQNCLSGYAVWGLQCFGDYCDALELTCAPYMSGPDKTLSTAWGGDQVWISDENGKDGFTFTKGFVWGMKCRDKYCDEIRPTLMSSSHLENTSDCRSTPYFSDGDKTPMLCDEGYFVAGLSCKGDYCDDISLHCCKAKIKWP